jgi:hypothetical protein
MKQHKPTKKCSACGRPFAGRSDAVVCSKRCGLRRFRAKRNRPLSGLPKHLADLVMQARQSVYQDVTQGLRGIKLAKVALKKETRVK